MIECIDLGLIGYKESWQIQEDLRLKREKGETPDRLLLLEHPPVFTLGKRDCEDDITSTREVIAADGIDIVKTNRGGRITYHGPGQLVGYFICNVNEAVKSANIPPLCKGRLGGVDLPPLTPPYKGGVRGIKHFVYLIEELCLNVLSGFGIKGRRDPDHPGIWVGQSKIAAIGLHVSRGITQHGFALNVNPDLNHYRHIIACGIKGHGTTSMQVISGTSASIDRVKRSVRELAASVFS